MLGFRDRGTEDIFNGVASRAALRTCPRSLWRVASRKLDLLDSAASLHDLKVPPANRLEALAGDRRGQHSVRINRQYRICFRWTPSGPEDVEITDYH
ncbi:plasmid maintenance system killer protein [Thioalkalivibrio denitrificans]|uniref:Plasmid maintenance system killer protein n=1 Tax=Thioalkalivibrio denitrificans TaxID=108003 RepID=A0A1V3NJ74_9GAMM|nr:type II toxin-antitoxin system RelE/ParE family toxin [Thioalkalivibrio denitrificans]OOG24816.1 plasmid maintenance system killer protein [Thioalkalivibrio denitrificans]